ncbi:MAG: DJ-1/PfpI family protein, partial [Alphaproteobacteria bacterium]|nr:DJ-1/PfpI family protein [Alphaproteobacteria bacterium]
MPGRPNHISLIAIPDGVISTLGGIYDVMSSFPSVALVDKSVPAKPPFTVEIVGEAEAPVPLISGLPITPHRGIEQISATDIIIVPSLLVTSERWQAGRYPAMVAWLKAMHDRGAMLCSACSGIFLLAETGLFDGHEATVHWGYANVFRKSFPDVPVQPEKVLVAAGERGQLITSGASTSWHDLVLYLLSRQVGTTVAQAMARFYALQWHRDGLAPYIVFMAPRDHGDAAILEAQDWLAGHYQVGNPVE